MGLAAACLNITVESQIVGESCSLWGCWEAAGRFHQRLQHLPSLSEFKCGERISVRCQCPAWRSWEREEAMEIFSAFVSAVLVCVVSAGIPHDGIHWTYTGRLFFLSFFFFFLRTEEKQHTFMRNLCRIWSFFSCVKRASRSYRTLKAFSFFFLLKLCQYYHAINKVIRHSPEEFGS